MNRNLALHRHTLVQNIFRQRDSPVKAETKLRFRYHNLADSDPLEKTVIITILNALHKMTSFLCVSAADLRSFYILGYDIVKYRENSAVQ